MQCALLARNEVEGHRPGITRYEQAGLRSKQTGYEEEQNREGLQSEKQGQQTDLVSSPTPRDTQAPNRQQNTQGGSGDEDCDRNSLNTRKTQTMLDWGEAQQPHHQ